MTLQASANSANPLTLSEIRTEFGTGVGSTLLAYVGKGGAPGSAPLRILDFLGRSATITLYNGGTVQGLLVTYNDGYSTYGNALAYTNYYGWYNNNGTAPSPATLTDGKTIKAWCRYDHYVLTSFYPSPAYLNDYSGSMIEISGFSSDPGWNYITSAKLGSSTLLTTSSGAYSYSAGVAHWDMQGGSFTIGQTGTYTGYIYR